MSNLSIAQSAGTKRHSKKRAFVKRILLPFATAAVLVVSTGCSMVVIDKELDNQTVVATVNGANILKGDVLEEYELYKSVFGITKENENSKEVKDMATMLKTQILDDLSEFELVKQNGAKIGAPEVTEEQKAEVAKKIQDGKDELMTSAKTAAEKDKKDAEASGGDPVDVEARTQEYYNEMLATSGINNGILEEQYMRDAYINNVMDTIVKDYKPTDEEIQAEYDRRVEEQKAAIKEDPAKVETFDMPLYTPAGMKYVKNLLIKISDEDSKKISELRTNSDTAGADAARDEALKSINTKAQEVYSKTKTEDFDKLMETYGEDGGMKVEPAKTEGYLIYSAKTDFDPTFLAAGMALTTDGQISEPIGTDFGYHIIKLVKTTQETTTPLSDVKDDINKEMIETKRTNAYETSITEWTEASDIKKYADKL